MNAIGTILSIENGKVTIQVIQNPKIYLEDVDLFVYQIFEYNLYEGFSHQVGDLIKFSFENRNLLSSSEYSLPSKESD